MGGLGLMQEQISQQNHDAFGANGWEISAHAASAPDHEDIQGKQYTDKEYEELNNSLVRRIGTLHCGHAAFPIIIGVNEPQYTPEQLEKFKEDNKKGVTYNGRHYTVYEATQKQRQIERAIRRQKRRVLSAEKRGDKDALLTSQIKLRRLNEEYGRYSNAVGLPTQQERLQVAGFGKKQAAQASSIKFEHMATKKIDWSETTPIIHSPEEQTEIIKYAQDKGINIYNIKRFDGDSELLKEQIDIIADMRKEYDLDEKITITFDKMDDDDFALTNGKRINFNTKCLRNRNITNRILSADNDLAANDISGIATHEMGHIISKKYGEKCLEIASKAYYNIYGEEIDYRETLMFLKNDISKYSFEISENKRDKPFKPQYCKEIVPEVSSKDRTNSNAFTREFIKLLKEVIS